MPYLRFFTLFLLLAFLLPGCSNPPPPLFPIKERAPLQTSADWRVRFVELRVENPQEDRRLVNISVSNGDEPYFIIVGFKANLGEPRSTVYRRNLYNDDEWAENLKRGGIATIPLSMGAIDFPDVQNNSVICVLAIAMESDRTPWQIIESRVASIREEMLNIARSEVEARTMVDPADMSFVDNLQQRMISAALPLNTALNSTEAVENVIFSGVDTDEVIGMNAMVFMNNPPAGGLSLPHYIPPYFVDALEPNKFYPLGSSRKTIRFENQDLDALYFTSMILQKAQQ